MDGMNHSRSITGRNFQTRDGPVGYRSQRKREEVMGDAASEKGTKVVTVVEMI
jgi:hypothetical protein